MMQKRVLGYLALLVVVGLLGGVLAAAAAGASATRPEAATPAQLRINGKPAAGGGLIVGGVPFVAEGALRAPTLGIKVETTQQGELVLTRAQVSVRVKPGAATMRVNGQAVPLHTQALSYGGAIYLPVEVLQAIYQGSGVSLTAGSGEGSTKVVLLSITPKGAAGGPTSGPASAAAPTQEFGKKGAKLEIVALLPITHGCHVRTEAELKKAYQQHPNDIHLIIADLFGPDAPKYLPQTGGGQGAVVAINGKTTFTLHGRQVTLRRQEGELYEPSQIGPIIEAELAGGGSASTTNPSAMGV